MNTTPALQDVVTQLAKKHTINLEKAGAYLRLELPGHGQLVIENIGANRISIASYVKVRFDWIPDPEIVVYIDYRPLETELGQIQQVWIPIEVTDLFGGWRLYAELDSGGQLILHDLVGQRELAHLAESVVAKNLVIHGWLDSSIQSNTPDHDRTMDEILARDIRLDEEFFEDKE